MTGRTIAFADSNPTHPIAGAGYPQTDNESTKSEARHWSQERAGFEVHFRDPKDPVGRCDGTAFILPTGVRRFSLRSSLPEGTSAWLHGVVMVEARVCSPRSGARARSLRGLAPVFWASQASVLFWMIIGLLACGAVAPLEPRLLEEGIMVHLAERMADGEHLYRDMVSFTGPLPFELLALLFRCFGRDIWVARGMTIAMHAIASGAMFGLARRTVRPAVAHAATGAFALAPLLLFPMLSIYFYVTEAMQLSAMLAYAALRGVNSHRWAVLAGTGIACVALCKQTLGVALVLTVIPTMFAVAPSARRVGCVFAAVLGGIAVGALTLAYYAMLGDLGVLYQSLVTLPLSFTDTYWSPYMNLWPLGQMAPHIAENAWLYLPPTFFWLPKDWASTITRTVVLTQVLFMMPFFGLAVTGARRLFGPLPAGVWIHAAILAALITNVFPRTDWGHLVYVLPAAFVQVLIALGAPGGQRGRDPAGIAATFPRLPPATWYGGVLALTFLLGYGSAGIVHTVVLYRNSAPSPLGERVRLRPVSPDYKSPSLARVVWYLKQYAQPREPIFVARAEPLLYFATKTHNPTPYSGVVPGNRADQERVLLSALESVRFVVMSDLDQPGFTYYRDELPNVQQYLERHFRVAEPFVREPGWILVLERGHDRGSTWIDLTDSRQRGVAWVKDANGVRRPDDRSLLQLPTRQNRRPFVMNVGPQGGGVDFEMQVPAGAVFETALPTTPILSRHGFVAPPRGTSRVSVGRDGVFDILAQVRPNRDRRLKGEWIPLNVDLAPYAGQRVTVRLELVPDQVFIPQDVGGSRFEMLGWWGSPRIALRPPPESRGPASPSAPQAHADQ
jgi:hypothetical protein